MRTLNSPLSLMLSLALLFLLGFGRPGFAQGVERTGEVLRELLQGVERDFETLERETRGFSKQAVMRMIQFGEKHIALGKTTDHAKREALQAEMNALAAQINMGDRREVEAALNTITEVRAKLGRIRDVLQRSGIVPASGELPRMRQKMGKFLSTTAQLIDKWEKAGLGTKGDMAALKATLLGTLSIWEAPAMNIVSSQEELHRTMRSLDVTYSQLLNLARALEQERHYLLVRNNAAVARLVLLRLNGGKINVGSVADAAEGKRNTLQRRMELFSGIDSDMPGMNDQGDASLGAGDETKFDRMKRGDFGWSKEGSR